MPWQCTALRRPRCDRCDLGTVRRQGAVASKQASNGALSDSLGEDGTGRVLVGTRHQSGLEDSLRRAARIEYAIKAIGADR